MGTDIHAAIEYREAVTEPWKALLTKNRYFGEWDGEPELSAGLDISRDYDLFAILGNVRNGTGFAGSKTGDGFEPMSDNRDVPEDISAEAAAALSNEHSATWVTLPEILAYDWDRSTKHRGCVSAPAFAKWDRRKEWESAPDSYSGGVSGPRVRIISNDEMRQALKDKPELADEPVLFPPSALYTWVEWSESYSESGRQMWTQILPKMLKLGAVHGFDNVRLVMDFDS